MVKKPSTPWQLVIDKGFRLDETGHTWLVTEEGDNHVAWFYLGEFHWLEVAITPGNYPGFVIQVIEKSQDQLSRHINENCAGWIVRKCEIDGVKIVNDRVYDPDRVDCPEAPDDAFIQFEYDLNFAGGDYDKVGEFAYVPASLVKLIGGDKAFTQHTGIDFIHVINWSPDDLYTEDGEYYDEDEDDEV